MWNLDVCQVNRGISYQEKRNLHYAEFTSYCSHCVYVTRYILLIRELILGSLLKELKKMRVNRRFVNGIPKLKMFGKVDVILRMSNLYLKNESSRSFQQYIFMESNWLPLWVLSSKDLRDVSIFTKLRINCFFATSRVGSLYLWHVCIYKNLVLLAIWLK